MSTDWEQAAFVESKDSAPGDDGRADARLSRLPHVGNEKRETVGAFRLTSVREMLAEPPESVAWAVDGLLPTGGISLVAGKPKSGKSTLARALALSVARGRTFLGRVCQAGSVLYLAHEDKRSEVREHFRAMGAEAEALYVHAGPAPADTDAAIMDLYELVREYGAVLIVVDTLLRFMRMPDVNDYGRVYAALEPLCNLARSTGCHVLTVHHAGKVEREGGDSLLGSTAFFGSVDTALILKRRGDGVRTLESIQRYGDDLPATVIQLDPTTRRVTAAGSVADHEEAAREQAILDSLGAGPLSESEIREGVGGNGGLVGKTLRRLREIGRVHRTGTGRRNDPYRYSFPVSTVGETRNEQTDDAPARAADGLFEPGDDPGRWRT